MAKSRYQQVVIAIALLTCVVAAASWYLSWPQPALQIPEPDLTGAHPRVTAELERLEGAVRQSPSSAPAWGDLGMVFMAHGWNAEAVAVFEHAGVLDHADVRWPYLQAMLLEATDMRKAADLYAQAATIDPNYGPLRYRWGQVLMRLAEIPAAEGQLRAASQLAPQSPYPLLALGRAAIAAGRFDEALTYFQRAANVAPYSRDARSQVARARFLLDDREQAERDQTRADAMPPVDPGLADPIFQEVQKRELVARQSAERADQLVASGDVDAAEAAFRQLIEERPDLSRPRLNLATLFAMQGDMRNAAAIYRDVIELFPNESLGYQGLGAVLERVGDIDGAISAYRDCVRIKPDFAQAHYALGLLQERQGELDPAVASYRAAIDADARLAPAYLALGLALQKKGELESAIASIENAVRLAPNDTVPRQYLQRARRELKESE